ncbi:MAG: ABC transporter substrate-binding protein [Betaproteobacteria bacterium]
MTFKRTLKYTSLTNSLILGGILAIFNCGLTQSVFAQTLTPIRAAYVPAATWLPAWVAKDKGIFENNGLDVTLTPIQNLSLLPGAVGKQFDFAASTPPDLIKAFSSGIDVVATTGGVYEDTGHQSIQLIVKKDSGISSIKDLKGKIVATPSLGAIMHIATLEWFKKNGGDPSTIRGIEVPFPNMGDQLKASRVDAIEAIQPFVGKLLSQPEYIGIGNPLLEVDNPTLFTFWIAQGQWAKSNAPIVKKWTTSLNQAIDFINKNPAEARVIMAKYTNLPPAVVNTIPFPAYSVALKPAQMNTWTTVLRNLDMISQPVDASKLIFNP